jgi:hypothetical protein
MQICEVHHHNNFIGLTLVAEGAVTGLSLKFNGG